MRANPEETWVDVTEQWSTNAGPNPIQVRGRSHWRGYSSVNTPGWPQRKQANNYTLYEAWAERGLTLHMFEVWEGKPELGWGNYHVSWQGANPQFSLMDFIEHDDNLLHRTKNAHQLEVADRKINLAQAMAERTQVVDTITDAAQRIAQALRQVRKGRPDLAARALALKRKQRHKGKSVASDWLALQYGWKPLLADVYGGAELLAQTHYSRPHLIHTVTRRSESKSVRLPGTFFNTGPPNQYAVPGWYDRSERYHVRMESIFEVSNEMIRAGGQTGLTDPATLAWELLPYSFVVDWFLPVGNFLQRLRFDDGLTPVGALQTQLSTMKGVYSPVGEHRVAGPHGMLNRQCSGSIASRCVRVDRTNSPSIMQVDPPRFKDPFSPTHALNALALLRVAAGR